MKKLTLATLLIISCATTWAADFDKGLAAYKAGDFATALAEFKPLAEQGDADAQIYLGFSYETGRGVIEDDKEAVKWYRLAAEQGNANAQIYLGFSYQTGLGVIEDDKEAVKWYRLAAEQGNAAAQFNLAMMYRHGQGVIEDDKEAVKWYRLAAEQGTAAAQSNLGFMYGNGLGVIEDDKEAVKWYRLAAEQGNAKAQSNLALMHANGEGVNEDYKEAAKWYRLAAEQDKGLAAYQAGDFATALAEWKPLAEQGDAGKQFLVGGMYLYGQGVPQDYRKAAKWLRLAAEQVESNVHGFFMGLMLDTGTGLSEKNKQAVRWYSLAAERGNANAQIQLGNMYDQLQGLSRRGGSSYIRLLEGAAQVFEGEDEYEQPVFLTDREASNYQPNDLDRLYRKAILDYCQELGKRNTQPAVYRRDFGKNDALCSGKLASLATDKYMSLPTADSRSNRWTNLKLKRSKVQKLLKKCFPALEESGQVLFVASGKNLWPKACGVLVFGENGLYVRGEVNPAKIDFSQPSFIPYSSLLLYSIPQRGNTRKWNLSLYDFSSWTHRKSFQICLGQYNNPVCQSYKFTASDSGTGFKSRLPELIAASNAITFQKLRNIYMSFDDVNGLIRTIKQLENQKFVDMLAKDNLDRRDFGTLKDKLIVVKELQENLDEIKLLLGIEVNEKTKSWSVKDDFASCQGLRTIDIAYRPKVLEELKASRRSQWLLPRVGLMCKSWYPEVSCFTPMDIATKNDCKSRFRESIDSVNDEFINYARGRTTSLAIEAMKQRRDTLALYRRYDYDNCMDNAVSEDEAKAQRKEAKAKTMRCEADNFATNSDNRLSTQACIDSISPAIEDCMKTGRSSISLLMLEAYAANAKIARLTGPITRLETIMGYTLTKWGRH